MADLITLREYKDMEGIQNPKDDYNLSQLISSVSQLVKTYCGNTFIDYYSTDKTDTFSIDWDTHLVQLTESPVVSVSAVETRDSVTSSYQAVTSTNYYLDYNTDTVLYVTGSNYKNWPKGPGAVKITYRAGYSSLPGDLKLAVIDLITFEESGPEIRTIATPETPGPVDKA